MSQAPVTSLDALPQEAQVALARVLSSTRLFCPAFLPDLFSVPFHELHDPILSLIDSPHNNIGMAAPRGVGKTTILHARVLRAIVTGECSFVVYCSATETSAAMQTDNLKHQLEYNTNFTGLFGPPSISQDTLEKETFSKRSWVAYGRCLILPRGVGQQVRGLLWRGKRPDFIVFDDLEDRELCRSEEQRKKLRTWYFSDVKETVSKYDKGFKRVWIDTLKHQDAFLKHILTDPLWKCIRLEACDEEFNPTAPSYMTKEALVAEYEAAQRMGNADSFMMEYRNLPTSSLTATFKERDFRYFTLSNRGIGVWTPAYTALMRESLTTRSLPTTISEEAKQKFSHHLPAGGYQNLLIVDPAKTVTAKSADSAYVVFGVSESSPYILIHYAKGHKLAPSEGIAQAIELVRTYNCTHLCVEITSLNLWAAEPYRQALSESGLACEFVEVNARGDKLMRIATLAPWYGAHKILHNMAATQQLEQQLKDFPYSQLVDVSDAAGHITGVLSLLNFTPQPITTTEQQQSTRMPIPMGNGFMYVPKDHTRTDVKESYI